MTIPGPSPASIVAGSCASERISIGVSPAVTQIGPRCTSPDLSFVGLVLLPIGFASDHVIKTINWHRAAPGDRRLRACAHRAGWGRQLDVPALGEHRISGEID